MQSWNLFTSKEVKPKGWLRNQLMIQANGLSGNLDKVWPDIRDSAWIGGDREGWERVPYWLDGFIPLAYLLEDQNLIRRAKNYIDAIIEAQQDDGWICPCTKDQRATYDTWATQLISKVLTVYYECSGDGRIPKVIYDTLKNYYELLKSNEIHLFNWAQYRWYETLIAIDFIYNRCKEDWLLELASILKAQGIDYNTLTDQWKRPINAWRWNTHIVNLMMMLKYEALSCKLLGSEYTDAAEQLRDILYTYNGTPVELFTGDECLSGLSPIQGTELCAVVELMYSYELLFAYTGDNKWAERLEVLAFNALPATLSDDMWAHQYVQMSNQIACERFPGRSLFRTNGADAHIFGLEPNFGCCTANFNQGWPKFALSAFMYNGDTVINSVAIPTVLDTENQTIVLETNYPFENCMKYTVEARKDFTFKIRVPSFAQNIQVNGASSQNDELSFDCKTGEKLQILVTFETVPSLMKRPYDLTTVRCGSLVFSVPVKYSKKIDEYEKDGVDRKFPYCDYEYLPESDWNYAYCSSDFKMKHKTVTDVPFSGEHPPVVLQAKVRKIAWGLEEGFEKVCAKVPGSREPISDVETIELYPYGCAKLRMTEIPLIK